MKRIYILTIFIYINFLSSGRISETSLDSIADHYFNEVEQSFFPNWDNMFIDMDVSTEVFPFMDELAILITETIESCTTSLYTTEEMRSGIYNIEIEYFPYGNVENAFDPFNNNGSRFLYSDEFKANGSYIINIWFHKEINVLDKISFKYKDLNFATIQFLLPFFKEITNISVYPLHDRLDDGFCAWQFIVLCGHIVKAQYTSEEYYLSTPTGGPTSVFYDLITKKIITENDFRQYTIP